MVSNIIMYPYDDLVAREGRRRGLTYTRYADDITLSGPSSGALSAFESWLENITRNHKSPKLRFNEKKRGMYTKGQRRMVTGLIITPGKSVSIGRQRKRMISSFVHKFTLGVLDEQEIAWLRGMVGFSIDAEPGFVERLERKYGVDVILTLKRGGEEG